ncbi:MAG: tetratricopeptide repeat protein [Candidatus Obscuribacter sp.]|nr:tetratricopeptide repeat protein [Candidatus Obscuribacter sp.]
MSQNQIVLTDKAKKQLGKANTTNYVSIFLSVAVFLFFAFGTFLLLQSGDWFMGGAYVLILPVLGMFVYLNVVSRIAHISFNNNYYKRRYSKIIHDYKRALALMEVCPFQKLPYKASMLSHLGLAELYKGDLEAAEDCFEEALMLAQRRKKETNNVFTHVMLYNLGYVWLKMGNLPKAALAFESASTPLLPKMKQHSPVFLALLKLGIAHLHLLEGFYPLAKESLAQAKVIIDKNLGEMPGESIFRYQLLEAELALATGDLDKARQDITKVLGTSAFDITTLKLDQLNSVAARCFDLGLLSESEKLYEMAYAVECNFPLHPDCTATTSGLEKVFIATGRADEVPEMKQWLRLPVID